MGVVRPVWLVRSGAFALAPLLDGSSAGELISMLARRTMEKRIDLEAAALLGAQRHMRT